MDHQDLLTQTLAFSVIQPNRTNVNIFSLVIDGKLTALAKMIQSFPPDEVPGIINSKDPDGKSPLFYACYFNFQNIVMFLMMKGGDPLLISNSGMNCFHICAYRGHLECAIILYQYSRHIQSTELMSKLKQAMKSFSFKRTDIQRGQLVCSDKHLKHVQARFTQFSSEVAEMFQHFLDKLLYDYRRAVTTQDSISRNSTHYSSLSKYTKSLKTTKFQLLYSLKLEGWDYFLGMFNEVQLLEVQRDTKIDPRQYHTATEVARNFLEPNVQETQVYKFMRQIKQLQSEVANAQDDDGYVGKYNSCFQTPMHLASFAGDFAAIQFLLSVGGNPKIRCKKADKDVLDYASNDMVRKYMVDLKNAARDGDDKSFQLLVNCGHKVDGKATIYGIAPIHNALQHTHKAKHDRMLQTVIEQEPDVNVADSNGWTPIHHTCAYGDVGSLHTLLGKGASITRFSNKGYYPIHIAALNNHPPIIDVLVEKGANLEVVCDNNCTAMHLAAKKGHAKVVYALFHHGASIYALDDRQWSPLHYAAFYEHKDVAHMLSRFDGDHEQLRAMKNSKGKTAKDLITNPEIKFAFQTLWRAASEGDLDTVRRLVILKHDVNEQTIEKRMTPLILATINEHFLVVKFLLANGADRSIRDSQQKLAADYASEKQNYKIFRLLDDKQPK